MKNLFFALFLLVATVAPAQDFQNFVVAATNDTATVRKAGACLTIKVGSQEIEVFLVVEQTVLKNGGLYLVARDCNGKENSFVFGAGGLLLWDNGKKTLRLIQL
jgi:hypothetical protein